MKRLSKFFLLATSALTLVAPCVANDANRYTIAGAVPSPGNYDLSHCPTVRMADLLGAGRLTTEEGTALILRGSPLQIVSSESISPNSEAIETPLAAGDIVIFRRYDGATPGSGYALVMTGGSPVIIALNRGELPLTHVLQAASLNFTGPVTLLRTAPGEEGRYRLNENDLVKDGDIIELSTGGQPGGLKITETFARNTGNPAPGGPATSTVSSSSEPMKIVISPRGRKHSSESSLPTEPDAQAQQLTESVAATELVIPERPRPSTLYVPLPENHAAAVVGSTVKASVEPVQESVTTVDVESGTAGYINNGQMELRPVDPDNSLAGVQKSPLPIHTASLGNTISDQAASYELSLEKTADSGETQKASGSVVWNSLFVCGLLLASGLIVAGWAKTRQEQQAEDGRSVASNSADRDSKQSEYPPLVAADAATVENESLQPGESESPIPSTADASADVSSLADRADDDCPVLSAGIQEAVALNISAQTNAAQDSAPQTEERTNTPEVADLVPDGMMLVDAGEWLVANQSAVEQAPESDPVAPATAIDESDLEDLVQNRLPMDLQQASFPLQIALFGKPSGPKRLRIDAAHTQIAAPHMASKRRTQRKETVGAAEQAQPAQKQPTQAQSTQGHRKPQQENDRETPNQSDKSRFDKALNFLEEQSEK